jgi:hypothetical protein
MICGRNSGKIGVLLRRNARNTLEVGGWRLGVGSWKLEVGGFGRSKKI